MTEMRRTMNRPNATWDAHEVLKILGTPGDIQKACRTWGLRPPAAPAIRMWRSRGRIPSQWMPTVLLLLSAHGRSPCDFIRRHAA